MNTFKNRLLHAMNLKGLKQVDLVNSTGIAKATMSGYMKGEFEPKQKNLHLISKSLKVNPSWLMGFDVPMEIENPKELKSVEDLDFSGINRIAAHFEGDEFSEDDLTEIQNFINYVKQKNKNKEK
nr:MAG TPA: bifunctional HTH-domain containing protein/aminotransferase [Caudoviricetes sp.]